MKQTPAPSALPVRISNFAPGAAKTTTQTGNLRYLMTYRDPEESGLVTIHHPRGNGTDNSPQWDAVLENVEVGEVGAYPCYDLQHVTDPSHRPTYAEYDRYLWLVNLIKRAGCDEASIYETHPFLVKDVLASAILVVANEALLEIG